MNCLRRFLPAALCSLVTVSASIAGLEITEVTPSRPVVLSTGLQQCIEIKYRYASAVDSAAEPAFMSVIIPAESGTSVGDFNVTGSVHAPGAIYDGVTRELQWDFVDNTGKSSTHGSFLPPYFLEFSRNIQSASALVFCSGSQGVRSPNPPGRALSRGA